MVFRRLLAILTPLVIALGMELFFYLELNIKVIATIIVLLLLILFVSLKLLIAEKIISKSFWGLAILPIFLNIFVINYVLILGYGFLRHLIIGLFVFVLYVYLENLFLFYYNRVSYQVNSLENSAVFYNLILFFLLVLNLNAFSVLLNLPLWQLSLLFILFLYLILWQLWWIMKIKNRIRFLYLLTIIIISLEFFWGLSFLPSNFYILAIISTIIYYFNIGIFRAKIIGELDRNIFLRYATISSILLLLILITSHWV